MMKAFILMMVLMLTVGCSSHGRVKCDGRLEPINAPAPAVKQTAALAGVSQE